MAFPTTLDDFPTAASLATETLGTTPHSTLHGNIGNAVEAIEAKVGVDSSAVTTSLDYLLKNASSSNPGHVHTVSAITDYATAPFADTTSIVKGSGDATKLLRFEVDGFTTGTTRVLTPPDANGTIAVLGLAQTWTAQQAFETGATGNAPVIFRQTGGVAGTNELQIGHGGTDVTYSNPAGAASNSAHSFSQGMKVTGNHEATGSFSGGNFILTAFGNGIGVLGNTQIVFQNGYATSTNFFQWTAGRKRLASAVTNTTTTLANLSDLSMTLVAGRVYTGRLVLPINEAAAADGYKLDFNGGTATMTSIEFGFGSALGATVGTRTSTALATAITLTALADTSDVFVEIPITLVCNAAGTFIPRQAKNSDAAGGTLTNRAGGYMHLEDTP